MHPHHRVGMQLCRADWLQVVMSPAPVAAPPQIVVVVAEDEEFLRINAVEFLADEGFITLEAEHAADAIALLEAKAGDVHVLFTDHRMPGSMSGFELVHHVYRQWPWIALLLTSGDIGPEATNLPAGCRFLPKPYLPHHVTSHIRQLVAPESPTTDPQIM
jgi:CheY-like chemotaxis protein